MRLLALLPVAVLLAGCSASNDYKQAERASDNFHSQMTSGNYDAIYSSLSDEFKATGPHDQTIGFFKRINRKMGVCGESLKQGFGVNYNLGGTFVSLGYSRKCANGTLQERFTWRIKGGKVELISYNANNPLLLID